MLRLVSNGRTSAFRVIKDRIRVAGLVRLRSAHWNASNRQELIEAIFPKVDVKSQVKAIESKSCQVSEELGNFVDSISSVAGEKSDIFGDFSYFIPLTGENVTNQYLINLGKKYVAYFVASQRLHKVDSSINIKRITKDIRKSRSLKDEEEVYCFIGKLFNSKSQEELDAVLSPFRPNSSVATDLIDYFNTLTPVVHDKVIDNSYLFANGKLDFERYDKTYNEREFELPKFQKHFNFNPLLLINSERIYQFHDMLFESRSAHTKEVSVFLQNLQSYGKSVYELNCFLIGKEYLDLNSRLPQDLLIESLYNRIVVPTHLSMYLKNAIINDRLFCKEVVYQYLGLLTYINGRFPIEWFRKLENTVSDPLFQNRKRYFKLPTFELKFVPTKDFPCLPKVSDMEVLISHRNDFESLGHGFLQLLIKRASVINNSTAKSDVYTARISNYINDSNPNNDCNGMSIFGYMVYKDRSSAEEFVKKFFVKPYFSLSEDSKHYCKILAFKTGIPLPVIRNNDAAKSLNHSRIKISCPPINNSILNRFLLLPCCVIQPSKKNSDGPTRWEHHPEIKEVLHQHDVYGELSYKSLVHFYLYKHKIELKKRIDYSDLYERLMILLWSPEFKKFVIEDSRFYFNQGEIGSDRLVSSLITKRSHKSLPHAMFNQYVAGLSDEARSKWVEQVVTSLLEIIHNLDEESLGHIFREIRFYLRKQELSLFEINKMRSINKLRQWKETKEFMRYLEKGEGSLSSQQYQNQNYVAAVGESYLRTIIMEFNMNARLESFPNLNQESLEIFQALFEQDCFLKMGRLVIKGCELEHFFVKILYSISSKLPHTHYALGSLSDVVFEIDGSVEPNRRARLVSLDAECLILPKLESHSSMDKLLSINFLYSRSFLDGIGANSTELSELITKAGSVGEAYYQRKIAEKFAGAKISSDILQVLQDILEDKKFMMVVNDVTNFVLHPFKDEDLTKFSSMLYSQQVTNSFYVLKFHRHQFLQYLASLYFSDRGSLDKWIDGLVDPILARLATADDVVKQDALLRNMKNELSSYMPVNGIAARS
ncbi:uncharacterized protein RJT20DRAFT_127815 [Scheffersomyces xylosifermentans]|uniref:uncharacterized protein n=1 Tax=Scheffersomyces xylosifermentans TaxID=1304137 RepID=UPI00315CF96C